MRFPLIDRFGNHDDPDELLNLLDSLEGLRTRESALRVRIKASVYMEERVRLSVELDHVERDLCSAIGARHDEPAPVGTGRRTTLDSPLGTSLPKDYPSPILWRNQ